MNSLGLVAAALLMLTSCAAYAVYSTQQVSPMFLMLNSDIFYPKGGVIISGQASPMVTLTIYVRSPDQAIIYRTETMSDSDGHFKVDLQNSEPLPLGKYTVKASAQGSASWVEFTVQDESVQLYNELAGIVKKTRTEAIAVYKLLDSSSTLATTMNTSILEGNTYYDNALTLYNNSQITDAMESYRTALRSYGDALHFKEQLSSSQQPSADTQLIIDLLEKIRRLNDTVADINNQPTSSWNPLKEADDLLTEAEKQLNNGDFIELHNTLLMLRKAMEDANTQTQMISASTTLSRLYTNYQETYTYAEQLEKEITTKLSASSPQQIELSDDIGKIKGLFYLMPWIQAVSSGKPYNSTEPQKPQINERYSTLNASIVEAEKRLSNLVESKPDVETLTKIYQAWDLLKNANLSLISEDIDTADRLYSEALVIMKTLG